MISKIVPFKDRLRTALEARHMRPVDLCNKTKISQSTMSQYLSGYAEPKKKRLSIIAEALSVNPTWLMGIDVPMEQSSHYKTPSEFYSSLNLNENPKWQVDAEFDDGTMEMMSNYFDLNDDGQKEAQKRVSELREIPRYLKEESENKIITLNIDSFEMPASAGSGMFLSDEYKEVIQVKDCYEARTADFVIPISGDSMEPLYSDGDRVFVKSMPMVEVGEIGIFVINGDAYIKKRGRDRLISLNRKRKDIVFGEGDTIVCLGKVIGKVEG